MSRDFVGQVTTIGHNIQAAEGSTISVGDLVITSLSSTDLATFTRQFLKYITWRDWITADAYLNSLMSVTSLDDESKSLLRLLRYKLEIYQGNDANIDQDLCLDLLRSPRSDELIKDVVESIYIHHKALTSIGSAKQRYINSSSKGIFTEEVFYEFIATKEELESHLSNGINDLYESELCSFVRCALRIEDYSLATDLSLELTNQYPNINSEIIFALSSSCLLHSRFKGRHYWLFEHELMEALTDQVNSCIDISKTTDDKRVIKIAAILFVCSSFEATDLLNICSENTHEAEKVVPEIGNIIQSIHEDTEKLGSGKTLLTKGDLTLNADEFALVARDFLDGGVTERQVRKWLNKGGTTCVESTTLERFIKIFLDTLVCDNHNKVKKNEISTEVEQLLNLSQDEISAYNIHVIYQLCINLRRLELPLLIVQILEPLLPSTPWASPVLELYAESLSASDQRQKLTDLLNNIQGETNTFRLLAVKIDRECASGEFVQAIELVEFALKKYPDHCFYWWLLLHTFDLSGAKTDDVRSAISRIPKELFEKYNDEALRLLGLVAKTDLNYAESIILEWFIDDPAGMAINVTNLHFGNLANSDQISSPNHYVSDRCFEAVVYTVGGRQYTKLLVDDCAPNEYLIDIEDPIGKLLSSLNVGEEHKYGIETYKLLEKLPPIIGAFRISVKIRTDLNVGNDCFYQFTFDESEGIEGFLKILDQVSDLPQLVEPEINGKQMPLLFRLNHTHRQELVKGAFLYLHDQSSNSHLSLYAEGMIGEEKVILDVLSLVYLSMTGLHQGVVDSKINLFVTRETHQIVLDWLKSMEKPEYLSISKTEEGFVKKTSEDVAKDRNIINLRALIDTCSILSVVNIDMPDVLVELRDTVDTSHYSSLKASISNSIPFLCMDSMLCSLYQQPELGVKLANVNQLLMEAKKSTLEENTSLAQCLVSLNLPVPFEYQDVIKLARGKEKEQFLTAQILKKYPNNFPSPEMALFVLKGCCLESIFAGYFSFSQRRESSIFAWRYTEHVFYASCESAMLSLAGENSTQRLSLLIFNILEDLQPIVSLHKLAVKLFRCFIHGHFLDAKKIDLSLKNLHDAAMSK